MNLVDHELKHKVVYATDEFVYYGKHGILVVTIKIDEGYW